MIKLICLFALSAWAALPPPQGKSVRQDGAYEVNEKPLNWFDVEGRLEKRNKLIDESKKTEAPPIVEPQKKVNTQKASIRRSKPKIDSVRVSIASPLKPSGNLPTHYDGIDRSEMKSSDQVVFVPKNASVKLPGVTSGDLFYAVVESRVKASPSLPTPIRALVQSGQMKGGVFIGEATLERELKRVKFDFTKVRAASGQVYNVKATGTALDGSVGLEGEYHTESGKFFLAEMASAAAAGYLDSTINRSQNTLGTYQQEPSLSNSTKNGAVTALSRSADRFAEATRQAPEYTVTEGYQLIKVFVEEDPTEN